MVKTAVGFPATAEVLSIYEIKKGQWVKRYSTVDYIYMVSVSSLLN
jgi:hypothetical protein